MLSYYRQLVDVRLDRLIGRRERRMRWLMIKESMEKKKKNDVSRRKWSVKERKKKKKR